MKNMKSGSSCTRKKNHDTEEDIFHSKLSEPQLISHILSFLPTRDAVRTSVLSKKWLNNWTFITKLDFDDGFYFHIDELNYIQPCTHCFTSFNDDFYVSDKVSFDDLTLCQRCFDDAGIRLNFSDLRRVKVGGNDDENRFVKFVNRALLLTHHNSSISSMLERFSLVIYNRHDVSDLNTWISCILNRGVKNLKIHSSFYELPFHASTSNYLLNSTLLEELELVSMFTTIKVPTNSVQFQHLKHLKLSGINFVIGPSYNCLTLKLPVLKKFEISNCNWSSGKDVIVEASLLESISIKEDRHELEGKSIKFNALYLKEFSYCGYGVSQQIYLSGCGFVSDASVRIILKQCENNIPKKTCFAFKLLQHFHQVKWIKLEGTDVLTRLEDINPIFALPELANLSHLELGLLTMEVILGLLQKLPVLKKLVLKQKIPQFAKELLNSAIVPDCLTSTLQIVNLEKVNGDEQELFVAEFVLKNGKMLERLTFSLSNPKLGKSKAMIEFKEKLYSFKKGPSFCFLEFTYD